MPEEKRKRPTLYKKDAGDSKDEDVLKKLKEVRQNLQESLDDSSGGPPKMVRKRGERRLYKKEDLEAPKKVVKPTFVRKPGVTVSKKRMAAVQKRVKAKIDSTKGISKKKKALILIWIIILVIPLAFITTLAVAAIEINFNGFGLLYNEMKPGTIQLTFPARNPSFLPARLEKFEIDLYSIDPDTGERYYVGKAYNNDRINIAPYQTEKLVISLGLETEAGGRWLSSWLSTMKISLLIGRVRYSGIQMDTKFLPEIEIDTTSILQDMISGLLDVESLLEGFSLEELLGGASSSGPTISADGQKIIFDPYTNARRKTLIPRLSQIEGMEDMTLNLSFNIDENPDRFRLELGATIGLGDLITPEDLGGIVLGPIELENLDVDLRVSTTKQYADSVEIERDDDWYKNYEYPIAKITSTKKNEIYIADPKERPSIIGMNMTILKDDPANLIGGVLHPSTLINWSAPASDDYSLQSFLDGTGTQFGVYDEAWKEFPGWYFLYNILGRGAIDCGISINNVDIEIFGLEIPSISLSMAILPPLFLDEGVLDPDNFLRIAPDYGLAGMLKHFMKGITEGPARGLLGIPPHSSTLPPEKDIDTFLNDIIGMIDFPDIDLESIEETWGDDARLHIELPITLNNTLFDFYMGFEDMNIGIASVIDDVARTIMELKLTGNESSLVYIPGIDPVNPIYINVEIDIYKNKTVAPFAVKFLSNLIENYTIDGIITAKFERLILFKENYTYGPFDVAIPLVMDMESMLMDLIGEIVPGLIGGLIDTNSTGLGLNPFSPIGLLTTFNPLPLMLTLLDGVPQLQQYAAQEEEEESDPIGDLLNGLINSLVNSLFGGMLGTEMEFELGLEVDVFPGQYTKFIITLSKFYLDEFFITIGLGDTDLTLQGKNDRGQWQNMVGIEVDNYFEIKEGVYEDIEIALKIYETEALCTFLKKFLSDFFNVSRTTMIDALRISGTTTLNLSGLFMPDLDILFTLEELDLGINGTELLYSLVDMIYDMDMSFGADNSEPKLLNLWAGPLNEIPIISQGINLDDLFYMGDISILGLSETKYGNNTDGVGQIKLSMDVINYMMGVDIERLAISIYNDHPTKPVYVPEATKLIEISIDDGEGLEYGLDGQLNITITIIKTNETAYWINEFIRTLELDGWINFSAAVTIFDCLIDLKPSYIPAINLTRLPIDLTAILGAVLPFTAPFMGKMGPRMAQDINIDSIFENVLKFNIGNIKIGDYQDVGQRNYTDPLMEVDVDLWIKTMFNLTINSLNISLLDGDLYYALQYYKENPQFEFKDIIKEAEIARLIMVNDRVVFDNCFPDSSRDVNGLPTKDPNMPYLVNTSNCAFEVNETDPWVCDVDFVRDYDALDNSPYNRILGDGLNVTQFNATGFTSDNYLMLQEGTVNNLSLRVSIFNKSHNSYEYKYARKYWGALGGPFFAKKPHYYNVSNAPMTMIQRNGKDFYYTHKYYTYDNTIYIKVLVDDNGETIKRVPMWYQPGEDEKVKIIPKDVYYHSPIVSLVMKALGLLTEEGIAADSDDIAELIGGIAIGGKVNVSLFSMDIILDLNNPRLNAMFEPISGLLLGCMGLALKEQVRAVATAPLKQIQHPREQMMESLMASQGMDDLLGDLLDFSNIPIDLTEIIGGLSFPGIADRQDHTFAPQTENQAGLPRTWDGHQIFNDGDIPKSILEQEEYAYDPEDMPGYLGGLQDPYFTGEDVATQYGWRGGVEFLEKEQFVKDYGYEWFKEVCQNWADSARATNPYFETNYTTYKGYQEGDRIEDPKDWPLLYSRGAFDGRCRTTVITFHAGVLANIPFGLLQAKLGLWLEDPYRACQYIPLGYAWVNSSVYLKPLKLVLADPYVAANLNDYLLVQGEPNEWGYTYASIVASYNQYGTLIPPADMEESDGQNRLDTVVMGLCGVGTNGPRISGGYQIDQYGNPHPNGWILIMNLRLFEGIASFEFLHELIAGGEFNIHFLAQGLLNVSIFGYEFYNIFLPYDILALGDPGKFQERCDLIELQGGGDYSNWGIPGQNGTLTGEGFEEDDEPFWPHYLLKQATLEFAFSLPIEAILDFESFLDLDALIGGLSGIGFAAGGLQIHVELPILNPVPIILIIESVYIRLDITTGTPPDWSDPFEIDIFSQQNIPLIDLSGAGYGGYDVNDPYDFRYNAYWNWHTPHEVVLAITAEIPLDLGHLLDLLWAILMGDDIWMVVGELRITTIIPSGLSYEFPLLIDLGNMTDPMLLEL